MPITEQFEDAGSWELTLKPNTPNSVLAAIDVRTYLWATLLVTSHDSLTPPSSDVRYAGVYLGQGEGRRTMFGSGIIWWLGDQGDGGNLYASTDATESGLDFSQHLNTRIFSGTLANGFIAGTINGNATTFQHKREGGDTRREMLDSICAMAPGGPYYWRVDPGSSSFSIDADTQANLWPSTTTPTVILSKDAGRETSIVGLRADLDLEQLNGEEVRSNVQVDWDDGTANGTSSPTLPSTYANLDSGSPVVRTLIDWRPKRNRPPTERWRKVAAWSIAAQARADVLAARDANERAVVRNEITARLTDVDDPWRYDITPGNSVYVWDLDENITGTAYVWYRGEPTNPTTGRVDEMTTPIQPGYGVWLRYWDGAAFQFLRLTEHVEFESGPTVLKIGHRTKFPLARARPRPLTRRQRRQHYTRARLGAFYDTLN
jgi:hypothetical protein